MDGTLKLAIYRDVLEVHDRFDRGLPRDAEPINSSVHGEDTPMQRVESRIGSGIGSHSRLFNYSLP